MRAYRQHWLGYTLCLAGLLGTTGCTDSNSNNNVAPDMAAALQYDLTPPEVCTPAAKECVTDDLARVCSADGYGWTAVQCHVGSKCSNGDCVADTTEVACQPNTGMCAGATTAYRCTSTGVGYTTSTCPAKTVCTGQGWCVGTCTVGATRCRQALSMQSSTSGGPSTVVETCADGFTWAPTTTCASGTFCVDTTVDPTGPQAACKAGDCTPDPQNCNTVCGNKNNSTADQTKFTSTCEATPNGYRWLAQECDPGEICDAGGSICAGKSGRAQATCSSKCTPGTSLCGGPVLTQTFAHCALFLSYNVFPPSVQVPLAIQVCGPDGKYAPLAACNPDSSSLTLGCTPLGQGKAACGDLVCAYENVLTSIPSWGVGPGCGPGDEEVSDVLWPPTTGLGGTCDLMGNFRACGTDGKLVPANQATHCTCQQQTLFGLYSPEFQLPGVTVQLGPDVPGSCAQPCGAGDFLCEELGGGRSTCRVGETRCQNNTVQACVNGAWVDQTPCQIDAGAVAGGCISYFVPGPAPVANASVTSPAYTFPLRAGVCGECVPGTHTCVGATQIKTCNVNAKFDPPVACAAGSCRTLPSVSEGLGASSPADATCLLDCIPGQPYCRGASGISVAGTNLTGTAAQGTCPANGVKDLTDPCPSGAGCCPADQVCRTTAGGVSLGCVQCVGTVNENGVVDTRCSAANGKVDGGTVGGTGNFKAVETCQPNNTWGPPVQCENNTSCTTTPTFAECGVTPS